MPGPLPATTPTVLFDFQSPAPIRNRDMDYPEDQWIPVSALNHFVYCPRRVALIYLEGSFHENVFTWEGRMAHQRVDQQSAWNRETGVREIRSLYLASHRLGLVGIADLVEFHPQPNGIEIPYPVDYKRGRKRRWMNDDVQLCAQALCLEEMLDVSVPRGAIFHVKSRRRREVHFSRDLRQQTEQTAHRLHELLQSRQTPAPRLSPRCQGCSLRELCLPEVQSDLPLLDQYRRALYSQEIEQGGRKAP